MNPSIPAAHSIIGACQRLSIGKTTVYALLKQRRIKSFKLGKKTLIAEAEIQRFVSEQMAQADEAAELEVPTQEDLSRPIPASRRITARANIAKVGGRTLVGGRE